MSTQVEPFDPEHLCPACGAGPCSGTFHEVPVAIVFGNRPQWPCADARGLGRHLCVRCETCGHTWIEATRLEGSLLPGKESPGMYAWR